MDIKNTPKKFNPNEKWGGEGYDDLHSCLEYNKPETTEAFMEIVAEVPGSNDEYGWWWIIKLANKKYLLLEAWCDCTGWDCQSGITTELVADTAYKASQLAPDLEKYSNRKIKENLVRQLRNQQPFGTIWEEKE